MAYKHGGFHVWDLSKLDAAQEVLHLSSFGPVTSACVISGLSPPTESHKSDLLLLLTDVGAEANFTVYSLHTGDISKRISIPYASEVQANSRFAVVSTASAEAATDGKDSSALVVFDVARDFAFLYSIKQPNSLSTPIFALSSSRMLAFASSTALSQPLAPSNTAAYPPVSSDMSRIDMRSAQGSALSSSLAFVSGGMLTGARLLGSGVAEGMRIGMNAVGYSGSKSRPVSGEYRPSDAYSRSAPNTQSALSSQRHYRRASGQIRSAVSGPGTSQNPGAGCWIIVVDLQPLASASIEKPGQEMSVSRSFIAKSPPLTRLDFDQPADAKPWTVAEAYYQLPQPLLPTASKGSPISTPNRVHSRVTSQEDLGDLGNLSPVTFMSWNRRGNMIAVGGRDSTGVQVYQVRRNVGQRRRRSHADVEDDKPEGDLLPIYDLQRGLTTATIDSITWSNDGLWNAFTSERGTIHLYAVDPDGGPPVALAHVVGQTRDGSVRADSHSIRLQAVSRLRQPYTESLVPEKNEDTVAGDLDIADQTSGPRIPASITFLDRAASTSSRRIPFQSTDTSVEGSPSSGFQDILVFNPASGHVLLWRCSLEAYTESESRSDLRAMERTSSVVQNHDNDVGRASPSTSAPLSSVLSGVSRMTGLGNAAVSRLVGSKGSGRLIGSSSVVARWDLQRDEEWPEIRTDKVADTTSSKPTRSKTGDLSFAELSPLPTRSTRLSRPIYMSHQFQFGALSTDYHALVRRLDLNPPFESLSFRKDSVIVRTGEGFTDYERQSVVPSDFDSEANFLGSDGRIFDLGDSPVLGGQLGLATEHMPFPSSLTSTSSMKSRPLTRQSFDDVLTSAMDSKLQLDASYSPVGSPSDIGSPGHVIPMLPNGRPGSAGSSIGSGLDAVVRGTARVGKDVLSGITGVRSPRLMPAKRASTDLLKFDEAEEMFIVDDLDGHGEFLEPSKALTPIKHEESVATIGPGAWASPSGHGFTLMTDSGLTVTGGSAQPLNAPETTWIDQPDIYAQAVEEEAKFDDVTGILDEERREREALRLAAELNPFPPTGLDSPKARVSKKGARKKKR